MMKPRLLQTIVALLTMVGSATAQTLTVKPVEVQTGGLAELVVSLAGGTAMTALQFNLKVPDGVTIDAANATLGAATDGHTLSVQTLNSGDLLFVLYSNDLNTLMDGEVLRIPVTVGNEAANATGQLYTVRIATAEAVSHPCPEVTFKVKETDNTTTGIGDASHLNDKGQTMEQREQCELAQTLPSRDRGRRSQMINDKPGEVYDLQGRKAGRRAKLGNEWSNGQMPKGLNIIRTSDGQVKKGVNNK